MTRLIAAALGTRVFPNLLMVGMIVAGLFSLQAITVKNFPEISTGTVQITVVYPGATPQEVSDTIVEPIENKIRSIKGIRKITATANQGVASISVALRRGTPVREAIDDIETGVDEITIFPADAQEPRITEVDPDELAIEFVLSGDLPRDTLKDLAARARDDLQGLQGISQVSVRGVPADEIGIEVSSDVLRAYGTGLRAFADKVGNASLNLSGGTLQSDEARVQVRTVGERDTGAGFGQIAFIAAQNGATVALSDIARIDDGLSEDPVLAELDGAPAVFVTVYRSGDEPLLQVVETAQAYVADTLKPRLPDTVSVDEWRNEASSLRGRISLLVKNAAIGAALILAILALVLDLRIAAWVSAGIIVSFVGTFALMQMFGITINQLSLFGFILALGIVVDDAIVVGESVYDARQGGAPGRDAALEGASRVARPIFYSVTTTILAFLPLLFLPGTSGSFISPVAAVVIMVLALSLIESFFVLPQHLAHLRSGAPRRFSPRRITDPLRGRVGGGLDRFAQNQVRSTVQYCVARPLVIVVASLGFLLAAGSLITSGTTKFTFFPEIEGNMLTASLEMPQGSAVAVTQARAEALTQALDRAADQLARDLDAPRDEIIQATAISIGFGAGAAAANIATVEARLQDSEMRTFPAARLASLWREEAGEIPGARQLTFSGSAVGVGADIALQVAAPTDENRQAAVGAVRAALQDRDGVFAIRDTSASASEEIKVALNEQGQALGIPLATLAAEVRAAIFGVVATEIQRRKEEVEVRVRLPEEERATLASLSDYYIRHEDNFVPLQSIATLSRAPAPTTVTRINAERVTTVQADVDDAITTGGAETAYVLENILPRLQQDYPEVTISLGGEQEEQGQFGPALTRNFVLALFAIYAVLALAFRSYTRPILLLMVLPFGFAGAVIGHGALGMNLTLLSMFGIIGLSGILINGALLIIDRIITNQQNGADDPIADAVTARFRPILLTTLTTVFGISPLILETSLQAQFLIPTAVSLGFGLLFGAVFVILLLPALAALFAQLKGQGGQARRETATP